jgi:dienelactone hydrolase
MKISKPGDNMTHNDLIPQRSIPPQEDLREMVRIYLIRRSLACMEQAAARRQKAMQAGEWNVYRATIRKSVRRFYGILPAGPDVPLPQVIPVSTFGHNGFRIENVLFDSFPGWQVNASVYIPTTNKPPFRAIIVPVGHSGKQFKSYQFPCQFFAQCGFLAVCFDPPGQASEKKTGNDHFNDGVRDYLLGETSSRYFIADAIRCIDYLATRDDVDLSAGVAMTGVSGGGTTTTLAALLDERITAIGPSCCLTPLADLDITQCYNGCPETHMFGRYADGVDEVDLICAAAPVSCLLMAGELDEVFRIEDTRRLAEEAAAFYRAAGYAEQFSFFIDKAKGHCYSLDQARQFVMFCRKRLGKKTAWFKTGLQSCRAFACEWPNKDGHATSAAPTTGTGIQPKLNHAKKTDFSIPDIPDNEFIELPYEELRCYPRTDINIRTLAVAQAEKLAGQWDNHPDVVRRAAIEIAGVRGPLAVPEAEVGPAFRVWTHAWRSVMLRPESGIELPATFIIPWAKERLPTILHFDDGGRHRLLQRQGLLAGTIRFLQEDRDTFGLLTVDLRGWGDTVPAMYPYEMPSWASIDRYLAYATAALGDPIMAMRIRDGLAALAWLRRRPEVVPDRIVLTGCGLGGVVALHVAVIDGQAAGVVSWDSLLSFRSLIEAEHYPWPADAFIPRILQHYDLPLLAASLSCPVKLYGLLTGTGQPANAAELASYQTAANITASVEASSKHIIKGIQSILSREENI